MRFIVKTSKTECKDNKYFTIYFPYNAKMCLWFIPGARLEYHDANYGILAADIWRDTEIVLSLHGILSETFSIID